MGTKAIAAASAVLLLLGACGKGQHGIHFDINDNDADAVSANGADGNISMNVQDRDGGVSVTGSGSGGISVAGPGFSGKIDVPGLQLGGDHMDIDGITPFPGTKFSNIDVDAKDRPGGEDKGVVKMDFHAPASAEKVLAYYADAARAHGFSTGGVSGGMVNATKPDGSRIDVAAAAAPDGSAGTLTVTDEKGGR